MPFSAVLNQPEKRTTQGFEHRWLGWCYYPVYIGDEYDEPGILINQPEYTRIM
jgi:hypothetical protein